MSTPLTNYLTTSNPTIHQFLEQIQLTPNGLVYQDILINTNQNQPVTYIGATNRERTRRKQLQEIASNITKTKQEKETLEIDLKNNENTQNEINTLKIKIAEQTTKYHQYKDQYDEHCKERNNLVSQQEQLENTQEPLLQSLNDYTQNQCSNLVQNYKDYQQLQKDLQRLTQDIERDKTKQEDLQTKHQNIATKLEDIKTKRIQEQEELENLQTDDRYQKNIDMINQFTQREETLKNKERDLLKTISNLF